MSTPASNQSTAASPLAVPLATVFGLGKIPVAPGTAGSLAGVALYAPLHYFLTGLPLAFTFSAALCVLIPVSLWSAVAARPHWGGDDPQPIIIDEVAGQLLTFAGPVLLALLNLLAWNPGWKMLLAGFALFRLFDIAKPWPISRVDRLPDPRSIVYDDLVAGIFAGVILGVVSLLGWLDG